MTTKSRQRLIPSKENHPPGCGREMLLPTHKESLGLYKRASSPAVKRKQLGSTAGVAALKNHWENHQLGSEDEEPTAMATESPTLSQLKAGVLQTQEYPRTTHHVHSTRKVLEKKHYEARSRIAGVSGVGGGVSLWPAMDDMRLNRTDSLRLLLFCALLMMATLTVFHLLHGAHITKLKQYSLLVSQFPSLHPLSPSLDQEQFSAQLMEWHQGLLQLLASIHKDFDIVWSESSIIDVAFLLLYIVGIITLLYLLLDNMFSKNRLTPHRIKIWISLLCVVMTWTLLSIYLLACAQSVETATQEAVHALSKKLAELVQSPLDLTQYHNVLLYWRMEVLPPAGSGVLSLMGLVQVRDVAYYLQYYSLPVLTALCTPLVKIVLSLRTVYKQ